MHLIVKHFNQSCHLLNNVKYKYWKFSTFTNLETSLNLAMFHSFSAVNFRRIVVETPETLDECLLNQNVQFSPLT